MWFGGHRSTEVVFAFVRGRTVGPVPMIFLVRFASMLRRSDLIVFIVREELIIPVGVCLLREIIEGHIQYISFFLNWLRSRPRPVHSHHILRIRGHRPTCCRSACISSTYRSLACDNPSKFGPPRLELVENGSRLFWWRSSSPLDSLHPVADYVARLSATSNGVGISLAKGWVSEGPSEDFIESAVLAERGN